MNQTLEVEFVLEALNQALARGRPKIINSDQGGQYTSAKYIELVERNKNQYGGRNRALDNIFKERLWRTLKYQEIYINDYSSPREARNSISKFFEKYNNYRPHQGLNGLTPAEVHYGNYTQEMINNPAKRPPCCKAGIAA